MMNGIESVMGGNEKEKLNESPDHKISCLIITGGSIDYDWAADWLMDRKYDYVIAADSGLEHAEKLGIKVNYILGDYDSVNPQTLKTYAESTETVTYPSEKDFTDTHLAVLRAVNYGAELIDLIGATGSRLDHTMTNIFVMKAALDAGVKCAIYDAHNKIYLIDGNVSVKRSEQYGKYISFAPMTEKAVISLSGVKYPLENYLLNQGLSICQSNEITAEIAGINVSRGILIVYETGD